MATQEILTLVRDEVDGWKIVTSIATSPGPVPGVVSLAQAPRRDGGNPLPARPLARGGILRDVEAPAVAVRESSFGGVVRADVEAAPSFQTAAPVPTDKYQLVPEGDLFRLRALRFFENPRTGLTVRPGDTGGLVSGRRNLSQDGRCWIARYAQVTGNVEVRDDAAVYGRAEVEGRGVISNGATVGGEARVSGSFEISMWASIYDNAKLSGNGVSVAGMANVAGDAIIGDNVVLGGSVSVNGYANLSGNGIGGLTYGRFTGQMRIRAASDFVTVVTRWGPLTLAKSERQGGYEFAVGCQSPDTLQELRETLEDNEASSFERDIFAGYAGMAQAALASWGISVEV